MSDAIISHEAFLTLVRTPEERSCARMLVDSIRSFAGALSRCPISIFEADSRRAPCKSLEGENVLISALNVPETVRHYYFAAKVYACVRAEEAASPDVRSLIWVDPACLITGPPLLYDLGQAFDAAVRPVHITNVGLRPEEPLDGYWKKICETVGVADIETTVETFVDEQRIRSYFNSHAFAVNPSKGLLRRWLDCYEALVCDEAYQADACRDELHQVFLHQAVWSALLVAELEPKRLRELPPDYNYPYNLHQSVHAGRRAQVLNDLVSITYENRSLDPRHVDDIEIHEPLRSWLSARATPLIGEATTHTGS